MRMIVFGSMKDVLKFLPPDLLELLNYLGGYSILLLPYFSVLDPSASLCVLSCLLDGLIAEDNHLNPTSRKAFAAIFYMVRLCFGCYE